MSTVLRRPDRARAGRARPWLAAQHLAVAFLSWWVATIRIFQYSRNMEIRDATLALAALGQATRLSVFRLLVEAGPEGHKAGDIAEALALPGATLSFHLKELSAVGLIRGEQTGRFIRYSADFQRMTDLLAFLTRNCCGGDASQCVPIAGERAQETPRSAGARCAS